MKFAQLLQSERARIGLTQPGLSALLGVPSRTLWQWENGKTEPFEITQEGAIARLAKAKVRK